MGGLDVARPLALYGAALALPVVVLHLYRKRRRRLVVPFLPLLRESTAPVRSFGGFARVAERVRLVARLGALAALVLAAAGLRPAEGAPPPSEDLVVVLDGDVTQRAAERSDRGTLVEERFDRSVALATAHVRATREGRVALVFAGAVPTTLVPPTADRAAVVAALERLDPVPGTADLDAAIATARGLRAGAPTARIVVVTARPAPADATDVEFATAGRATEDLGFVDAGVAPAPDATAARARFVVRNFGLVAVKARVRATWRGGDGKPVHEADLDLAPGAEADVVVDAVPPKDGGVLAAEVFPASGERDPFAEDDVAAVAVAAVARPSVLVVHGGAPRPFVRALLEAMGDTVDREASGFVAASDLASATGRDLLIFDGAAPPAGAGASNAIWLAPFPEGVATPFRLGRTVTEPLVWRAAADHPLLRGVDLATAYVAKATTIGGEGVTGLAFVEGEAVLAEGGAPGARFVALGLDPDGSDLPVRAALPILLKNAIRRLSIVPAAPLPPFVRAGTKITPRAALGGPWRLEFESLAERRISRRDVRRAPLGTRPGAGDRRPPDVAPWLVPTFGPETPAPEAPPGGPFVVTLRDPASGAPRAGTRTVTLDLDRGRDIRPARPESPLPAPLPFRPEDTESRWARLLLVVAGGLLVADVALGLLGRRKVARPSAAA